MYVQHMVKIKGITLGLNKLPFLCTFANKFDVAFNVVVEFTKQVADK